MDNRGNRAIHGERERALHELLFIHGFWPLYRHHILEIGCGSGGVLGQLLAWGASPEKLYGIDLLPDRVIEAQERFPNLRIEQMNAEALAFEDSSFDLVVLFTVLPSILDAAMARNVAGEVQRVLKPGGAVVWYDFRYDNPWNRNVRGVRKKDIAMLFPGFELSLRTVTVLPPLARRLGILTSVLYPVLSLIPPLRTHYLGLLIKPA